MGLADRLQKKKPENKQKGYETLQHDMILWHAIRDHRGAGAETTLSVDTWGVTIDWRLIRYDQKKREEGVTSLPVVLYPANLSQLLQFWAPRTQELEKSVLDSLRLPLFFYKFDPEDEAVTVKIIKHVSRYENVDDLGEDTIGNVLADTFLRERIRAEGDDEEAIEELVKDAIIQEHKSVKDELALVKNSLADRDGAVNHLSSKLILEERRLSESEREKERYRVAAEEAAAVNALLRQEAENTSRRVALLEAAQKVRAEQDARRWLFLGYFTFPLIVLSIGWWYGHVYVQQQTDLRIGARGLIYGGGVYFPLLIWFKVLHYRLRRCGECEGWWLAKLVGTAYRDYLLPLVPAVIMAILQGGVWDAVKDVFTKQ